MPTVTGDNFFIDKHNLQFRTGVESLASISYAKTSESISINNEGTGSINIGDAGGDIYIGDGSTETDIIFEQNGAIRALSNKTLSLGQSDSNVQVNAQNFIVSGDLDFSGSITSNLSLDGDVTMADGKYIGIGSTLAAIQFGDGSIGNEIADLSFVTNADGEFVFNRGGTTKLIIGSTTNVSDGDFFVDTDTLYVDASENRVGIGTTSPERELTVSGRARIWNSASSKYIEAFGGNSANFIDSHNNSLYLRYDGDSTKSIILNSAGNVGLGGVPSSKLQVGTGDADDFVKVYYNDGTNLDIHGYGIEFNRLNAYLRATTDGNKNLSIGTNTRNWNRLNFYSSDDFLFYSGSTELVRVTSDGDVGIGTTDPAEKLHVDAGNIQLTNGNYIIFDGPVPKTTKMRSYYDGSQTHLAMTVANTNVLDLRADGKVGIGTDSPAAKLDIFGDNSSNAFNIIQGGEAAFRFSTYIEPTTVNTPVFRQGLYYNTTENATIAYCRGSSSVGGFLTFQTNTGIERMRLASNGRLGIGVTSPTSKLDVNGDVTITHKLIHAGDTNTYLAFETDTFRMFAAGEEMIKFNSSKVTINEAAGNNDLQVKGNTIDNLVYVDGSADKVGIGTNSPTETLEVTGDIFINGGPAGGRSLALKRTGAGQTWKLVQGHTATDYLEILEGSDTRFLIKNGGNVGIGTNNPDSELHIHKNSAGSVSAISQSTLVVENNSANAISMLTPNNTTSYLVFGDPDDNQRGYLSYTHTDDTMRFKVGGGERMFITGNGNISIGTTAVAPHKLNVNGTISRLNSTNIQVINLQATSDHGQVAINNAGGTEKVLLNSNGDSYLNGGDVGIGTATPDAKLHVEGSMQVKGDSSWAGTDSQAGAIFMDTAGRGLLGAFSTSYARPLITANSNYIEIGSAGTSLIYGSKIYAGSASSTVGTHNFYTSGTNLRMHIAKNGNVGIGLNDPDTLLEVAGVIKSSSTSRVQADVLNNSANSANIIYRSSTDTIVGNNASALVVQDGGNVGIGTTSPEQKLHVYQGTTKLESLNGSDNSLQLGRSDNSNLWHFNHAGADLRIFNNAGNGYDILFGVNGGGSTINNKVGIGTAVPSQALDIVGYLSMANTRSNNTQKIARQLVPEYNNSHGAFLAFMGTSNVSSNVISYGGGTSSADAATEMRFYTASAVNTTIGTERMRISSAGNVGIGLTSSASYKLEVNGAIVGSSKSFLIDHPTKEGKQLMHSCIEGPEYAVYFRGKSNLNVIKMPDYWEGLVDIDTMTVELTAIGANQNIYVDSIAENGEVTVGSNTDEPLNYFYVVYGERKDIDKLETEITKPQYAD